MKRNRRDLILLNDKGESRYLKISPFFVFTGGLFLAFLLASYAMFAVLQIGQASAKLFSAFSMRQSNYIHEKFNRIENYTKILEMRIDSLFIEDDARRLVTGAPPIQAEVRQVGIGGPSTLEDYEKKFFFKDDRERQTLKDRLDKLIRQTDLQLFSLADFQDFFSKKRADLDHLPTQQPTNGSFLSGFGMRLHPVFKSRRMHFGLDIANTIGTPVVASAEGTAKTGLSETFGAYVLLNHENGFSTIYAHLQSVIVTDRQMVQRGQIIGYLGNSGLSTGPHLHYEVHLNRIPQDPFPYVLPEGYIVD
jgi:hypothetical protein